MLNQISFFDGTQPFRNDKPIRLIELFAGYGSQALALKYLGVPFEHYRISEWATKSIHAYKNIHAATDKTDYSNGLTVAEIKAWLANKISLDYDTPASRRKNDAAVIQRDAGDAERRKHNAIHGKRFSNRAYRQIPLHTDILVSVSRFKLCGRRRGYE